MTSKLRDVVVQACAQHGSRPEALLQILLTIQHTQQPIEQQTERLAEQQAENVISTEVAQIVADELHIPVARVLGVAGFYSFLSTAPQGRYRVLFSDNITDRMQGNIELLASFCKKLWVEQGHLSEDGLVSVDTTSCTGMCDQGPAMLVNGYAIPKLTPARVDQIADLILAQTPVAQWPQELFRIEDNIHRRDMLLGHTLSPGDALRAAIQRGAPATLEEIKKSGLRGRGGAGFSTAQKWVAFRDAPCDVPNSAPANTHNNTRYVVCNADEGEPGTFKDRVLLNHQADLVFEGMTIAALAVSANGGKTQGFLYLRGEYRYLLSPLNAVLERRRAAGLLGKNILGQPGFDFDITLHLGAGAYVCGEESALIESLEGKRGIPRNRPPYPVAHGYLQHPTLVNNVETFCAAALIAHTGGEAYQAIGTAHSAGTKLLSVAGDCARPGIYEYPFGTPVRQVLQDCGANDTQAVQISGPSGVCIGAADFDRLIAFEDLPTAGAFTVFNQSRDMFEVARNFAHFFAHESCGFCTPCRVGTSMLKHTMDKIAAGHGTYYDLAEIEKLDRVLQMSAHCGLGHSACNPTLDTLKHFRPAYERRLKAKDFEPAFDLDGALARARLMTGRDDAGAHLSTEARE